MKDVMTVKKKIFGEDKNTQQKLRDISRKLEKQGAGIPEIHFFRQFISLFVYRNTENPVTSKKKMPALKKVTLPFFNHMIAFQSFPSPRIP